SVIKHSEESNKTTMGLSPDLAREEVVSFRGELKEPLVFRDSMLVLREIVLSDLGRKKKKDRKEYREWLEQRINELLLEWPQLKADEIKELRQKLFDLNSQIFNLKIELKNIKNELDKRDIWYNFRRLLGDFYDYIKKQDYALWWVLDPIISVYPDAVSFEAFSTDESIYGNLTIDMTEFNLLQEPSYGTTNIDFSAELAQEIKRFRTYNNVELAVNPEGFSVDVGVVPEHIEKKIDLPNSWVKGLNQVSAAAGLPGTEIDLSPTDLYDILSFLRRHRAHTSPRSMKIILTPNEFIKVNFQPWNATITLSNIYRGKSKKTQIIWGRRRWFILEKLLPIAKSFKLKMLGFAMPYFITADLGKVHMTIGFTAWSAKDWVDTGAFYIMAGFLEDPLGTFGKSKLYTLIHDYFKKNRSSTIEQLKEYLINSEEFHDIIKDSEIDKKLDIIEEKLVGALGILFRKGLAYFDLVNRKVRYRPLSNSPLPRELFSQTELEKDTKNIFKRIPDERIRITLKKIKSQPQKVHANNYQIVAYSHYNWKDTKITFFADGELNKVQCTCSDFKDNGKNMAKPCEHILALYIKVIKYIPLEIKLEEEKAYSLKDLKTLISTEDNNTNNTNNTLELNKEG
ncbi:MAG: hypothetical protein ACTSXF_02240, partial [Promethearchaeota archaeon]